MRENQIESIQNNDDLLFETRLKMDDYLKNYLKTKLETSKENEALRDFIRELNKLSKEEKIVYRNFISNIIKGVNTDFIKDTVDDLIQLDRLSMLNIWRIIDNNIYNKKGYEITPPQQYEIISPSDNKHYIIREKKYENEYIIGDKIKITGAVVRTPTILWHNKHKNVRNIDINKIGAFSYEILFDKRRVICTINGNFAKFEYQGWGKKRKSTININNGNQEVNLGDVKFTVDKLY